VRLPLKTATNQQEGHVTSERQWAEERALRLIPLPHSSLTETSHIVVLKKSISAQICQLILYMSNKKA
jgi:hypothetical protein